MILSKRSDWLLPAISQPSDGFDQSHIFQQLFVKVFHHFTHGQFGIQGLGKFHGEFHILVGQAQRKSGIITAGKDGGP